MFAVLVASFVVACCLLVSVLVMITLHRETRKRSDEIILAAEPLRPEWIYGRRMDVPRKRPLLHTRSTKVW